MNEPYDDRTAEQLLPYRDLTAQQLREMLAEFGIHEKPVGPNGEMGYLREDFEPVWKALGIE